jgi:exosortase A
VILPLCLYLVWSRRHQITPLVPIPHLVGLLLLAIVGFGWLVGHLTDVVVVQQMTLVLMLQGFVWTVLGTAVTRALLFPLAFLFFAVPVGEFLIPYLQDVTVFCTVKALQLSGVPVLAEGRLLETPAGRWIVAEECAGIRHFIASAVLGCLYAHVMYRSWARRLYCIVLACLMPVVANGLRVYGILIIAYFIDRNLADAIHHNGFLFFWAAMLVLFSLGLLWQEPVTHGSAAGRQWLHASRVGEANQGSRPYSLRAVVLTAVSSVVLLALAPLTGQLLSSRILWPVTLQLSAPAVTPPWQRLAESQDGWTPHFIGTDAEVFQSYTSGAQHVHLYIAYYLNERQGAELINSDNRLFDTKQWKRIAEGHERASVDGQAFSVYQAVLRSASVTRLVWSWYWVGGVFTSNPYYAKLLRVKTLLFGGPQGAAVIVLGVDVEAQQADAVETFQEFLHHTSVHTFLLTSPQFTP